MRPVVDLVRWFNRVSGWNQLKPSLAKRAAKFVDRSDAERWYDGIEGDIRMRLNLSRNIDLHIFFNTYQLTELQVLRKVLRDGDVFVDGGANIGLFSLLASRLVGPSGKVYSFEPNARALARLEEHLRENQANNVILQKVALWSEAGTATFFDFEGPGDSQGSLGKQGESFSRQVTVPTARLDDLVPGRVRLMKLDIEGAELAAMRGGVRLLTADPRPHLLLELNPTTCRPFNYEPIEMMDWLLAQRKGDRLWELTSRRRRVITRDALAQRLKDRPNRYANVWCEPLG